MINPDDSVQLEVHNSKNANILALAKPTQRRDKQPKLEVLFEDTEMDARSLETSKIDEIKIKCRCDIQLQDFLGRI